MATAQTGGQKLKHRVLSFLVVGQNALHHIFGVHDCGCQDMEPQKVLVDAAQAGKCLHKHVDHYGESAEIAGVSGLIVLGKGGAVPKAVVKNRLVRVGDPKAEVGLPQAFHRPHGVGQHGERVEFQAVKNLRGLLVHIGEALLNHLVLALKVAVQRPGGDPRQIADILDAHAFQAVLPHGLHRRKNDPHPRVVQSSHFPPKPPASPPVSWRYYTLLSPG